MPLDSQSHKSHRRNPTRRDALKTGSLGVLGLGLSTVRIPADQSAPPKLYLEAYTDRSSYEAGDDVSVHVSTNAARYAVEIARLGAGREMVWSREDLPGAEQPVPDDASAHGCKWPIAFTVKVSPRWKTGYYAAQVRLAGKDGKYQPGRARELTDSGVPELFFVIRPAHPGRHRNTYRAWRRIAGVADE